MAFSEYEIQAVWEKGQAVPNNDPNVFRKDACGAWMRRNEHGNRSKKWGWEIDHINPDGGDHISNLQPLQWANNAAKSDGVLKCAVTASGTDNGPA